MWLVVATDGTRKHYWDHGGLIKVHRFMSFGVLEESGPGQERSDTASEKYSEIKAIWFNMGLASSYALLKGCRSACY